MTNDETEVEKGNETKLNLKKLMEGDRPLRFAIKSRSLINALATHLDKLAETLGTYDYDPQVHDQYNKIDPQDALRKARKDIEDQISKIHVVAEDLRNFNANIASIYKHNANAARITHIGNPANLLGDARDIFTKALDNPLLTNDNLIIKARLQADIDAIDKRLSRVMGTEEFKTAIDEYNKNAQHHLAQAQRGTLPEGLGQVTTTHLEKDLINLDDSKASQRAVPRTETKRRPTRFDEAGKPVTGIPLYREIKREERARLASQSEEAEKSRSGEGPAWVRRLAKKTEAAVTEEIER